MDKVKTIDMSAWMKILEFQAFSGPFWKKSTDYVTIINLKMLRN